MDWTRSHDGFQESMDGRFRIMRTMPRTKNRWAMPFSLYDRDVLVSDRCVNQLAARFIAESIVDGSWPITPSNESATP